MFRYERPQKGRLRQHYQIGAEILGVEGPLGEVELISMACQFLDAVGVGKNLYVQMNSLGTAEDRAKYRQALVDYLAPHKDKLSEESKIRLKCNPLRILDTKDEADLALVADAPKMKDYLSAESETHFKAVQKGLDGLGIRWEFNGNLVRGLDYYSHTVFEIHSEDLGSQSQVLSGGRYDGLIGQMGGDEVPALGFGSGMERIEALMGEIEALQKPVAVVAMGQTARLEALKLSETLRSHQVEVAMPLDETSFKSQFKKADKTHAQWTIILGEDEVSQGVCGLKNMQTSEQQAMPLDDVVDFLVNAYKG